MTYIKRTKHRTTYSNIDKTIEELNNSYNIELYEHLIVPDNMEAINYIGKFHSKENTWWVDAKFIEENNTIEFTYDQNKKVWLMKSDDPNIGADNLVLSIEFADGYEYSLPDKQRYETCEMPALNNIGGLL